MVQYSYKILPLTRCCLFRELEKLFAEALVRQSIVQWMIPKAHERMRLSREKESKR